MVKKVLAIILSSAFLVLGLNLHFDVHYCHDELTEISFSHNEEHCGGQMFNSCMSCEDIHIDLDNDQDQISQSFKFQHLELQTIVELTVKNTTTPIFINNNQEIIIGSDSSPPIQLYKLYSRLCFYG